MGFMITSDASKQYLLEEDAVKGFEMAVNNGQSRLALSILVDIVHGVMEVFNAMMDDETEEVTEVSSEEKKQPTVEEPKSQEKKKPEQKQESKKDSDTPKEVKNTIQQ